MLTRKTTKTTEETVETTSRIDQDMPCEGCPEPIRSNQARVVCDFTGRDLNVAEHMHMTCYFASLAHAIPGWE